MPLRNGKMTMHRHSWAALLSLVVVLAALGCQPKGEQELQGAPLKVSLALVPNSYSGLIAIADAKGFFKECGLEVTVKDYPSGLAAVEALIRGEVQLATGADMVMATKIFDDPSLRVVASIGSSGANEIVARKDRNIREPSDLKGKKVGFSRGTSSEYYLDSFLLANTIPSHEVSPVNIPPAKITEAIVSGEVDAISSWDVNVYSARKRLGENGVSWAAQNYLDWYWLLIAKEELTLSPEPIKRFLRALLMAESFLLANDNEAKNILIEKWSYDPAFIDEIWEKTRLNVTLNQSMITCLENFARWKMRKEGRLEEVPNYLNHIYTGAMDEIEPRAVTIFR
jgi:NitT/TauT family transport system substrate-binding protein